MNDDEYEDDDDEFNLFDDDEEEAETAEMTQQCAKCHRRLYTPVTIAGDEVLDANFEDAECPHCGHDYVIGRQARLIIKKNKRRTRK